MKFYQHKKIKKFKINNILFQKKKDMLENPDFKQDYCSGAAKGIYKVGNDSIRLMKLIASYDRSYHEKINIL